jgi:mannose-6-phosphate isomerase
MTDLPVYPLRLTPICQYRLWGGRNLAHWLSIDLPDGPVGEAWLVSDRDDNPSMVSEGPLKGRSLAELVRDHPKEMLGTFAGRFTRFPLLLKYLDVAQMLSVQVHPSEKEPQLIPPGEQAKTEGWVVLEAKPESRIYAGLKPGATEAALKTLSMQTVDTLLPSFTPQVGQSVLIEAGDVHSLGDGVVVLEIQQNSDMTFRLYDWDHIDQTTGQKRPLQVDKALQCVAYDQGVITPVVPVVTSQDGVKRERLLASRHFQLSRVTAASGFKLGEDEGPAIVVCLDGSGSLACREQRFAMTKGDVLLLPAAAGVCAFVPAGEVTVAEITIPETLD